jgi:hypothetical protein
MSTDDRACRLSVRNKGKNYCLNILDDYLEFQTGKFPWGTDVTRIRYQDIREIVAHKGLNPLSSGTLTVLGGGGATIHVTSVRPSHLDMAVELIEELRSKHRNVPTDAGASIPQQIKQLADLKDAGLLSEVEFQSKKTELLGRM